MFRFIAFLRAINVGGGRTVKMQSLRQVFESLGFSSVDTFIASGNVVFETRTKTTKKLERKIERALRKALGYEVRTFVRGAGELTKIVNYWPFSQSKFDETWQSNIIFLANNLNEKLKQDVNALGTNTDAFEVHGREIYWRRRWAEPKADRRAAERRAVQRLSDGRQFWVVAAERADAGRFIVHAHDISTAFLELRQTIHRQVKLE